jgi:virginiamycin B lyase
VSVQGRVGGRAVAALVCTLIALLAPSQAAAITEYELPVANRWPAGIAPGPVGAMWFTEYAANPPQVGRITTDGQFTEFPLPLGSGPDGITVGFDGALWLTLNSAAKIGRITVAGAYTEYPLPLGFRPGDITRGPDGRLWFTESEANRIGAITMDGVISEYALPAGSDPSGIAASDAALWFTQYGAAEIGRISTIGLNVTEFGPTAQGPSGIAFGRDGALWFTETVDNKIGRMTTTGRFTHIDIPTPGSEPGSIVAGPDGALWFTEFTGNKIGRVEVSTVNFVPPAPPPAVQPASKPAKGKSCRVPRLRGLTLRKARKKLRRAGCRYRVRGKGRIVSSRPRAGQRTRAIVRVKAKRKRR